MENNDLLSGKKLLIVDDEPDVLDTLKEMLYMCDISLALSFDEAKELIESQHYDLAILDIAGVNGYKLLEIANKHKIICVMLTANALTPHNLMRAYQEGAASFIPKDKMVDIQIFLNDILEAKEKGKSFWWRWLTRLSYSYWENKFGAADLRDIDKEFWEKLACYDL